MDSMGNRMRMISYGAFNIGQTFAVGAAGMAAPLVYATKKALDFEDQMASVAKVADIEFGSHGFKQLGNEAKNLSIYLGNSAAESAKLYEVLAQGGMDKKDLTAVAKIAGQTAIAFDIEAEAAANAFGYIKNLLNLNVAQTSYAADAINALSNTRLAKAEKILTFMSSGGAAVARAYKMTAQDAAAFGATMVVNGQSGEEAATVMERFAKWINKIPPVLRRFNQAGGGTAGFLQVLNDGLKSKDPNKYFQKFGDYGNQIKALAMTMNDPKGLINALDLVNDRSATLGSAQKEFTAKQKSTMSFLKREWAAFNAVMIDVGDSALPVLRQLVTDIKPLFESTAAWVRDNPRTVTAMIKFGGAVAAMAGTISIGAYLVGSYATAMRAYAAVAGWLVQSNTMIALAQGFKDIFVYSGIVAFPVWGVVAAIAGLGYVAYKTYENLMYLPETLTKIATGTQSLLRNTIPMLDALFHGNWDKVISISARADMEATQDMRSFLYGDAHRMTIKERREMRRTGVNPYENSKNLSGLFRAMAPETFERNRLEGSPSNKVDMGRGIGPDLWRNEVQTPIPYAPQPIPIIPGISAIPSAGQKSSELPAINFSPTINFQGGTPGEDVVRQINEANEVSRREFERLLKESQDEAKRRKY